MKSQFTVKEMLPDDQPRERMLKHGPETLSDAELLAILFRTGNRYQNVIDLSRTLLSEMGGLGKLNRKSWQELAKIPGVGKVKSLTLIAALELGRRSLSADFTDAIFFRSPDEIAAYFIPRLKDLRQETFQVVCLTPAKSMITSSRISLGGATSTVVDPSEVIKTAILNDAHSIILIHNHPSGNPKPSQADIKLTRRIKDGAQLLGIGVDDHLIIAGNTYTSMHAEQLM